MKNELSNKYNEMKHKQKIKIITVDVYCFHFYNINQSAKLIQGYSNLYFLLAQIQNQE